MTNDTMHNNNNTNNNNDSNNTFNKIINNTNDNKCTPTDTGDTMTRMHPSMKRPRAPIACYRCHHKKVRCDGVHPNCTRCLSTGVLCAYPSSRRSRNTQPTNVDPFIDNLSQLEVRIRRIETDLESQRALVQSVCDNDNSMIGSLNNKSNTNNALTSRMQKTEKDLQESRSIVAQLRLRGEQRAARGRRAAAAAAASVAYSTPGPDKNNKSSTKGSSKVTGGNTATNKHQQRNNKLRVNSNIKKEHNMMNSPYIATMNDFSGTASSTSPSPPFYFTQSDSSSPVDFINSSSNFYFPYSPNTQFNTDAISTPICGNNSSSNPSSAQFTMMVNDWPLLNELQQNTIHNNGFVDPMIIATAEAHQQGIAPPLLSVSSYMAIDEDNSIMAARAKSLSHLPPSENNMMTIPGLQPSSSSTSTSSNTSNFGNFNLYDTSYASFMNNSDNHVAALMMTDQ